MSTNWIGVRTKRPAGSTGVHWQATSWTECFAVIDTTNSTSGSYEDTARGQYLYYPTLTGALDDCSCDAHREMRQELGLGTTTETEQQQ